jgi:hypothetical protein
MTHWDSIRLTSYSLFVDFGPLVGALLLAAIAADAAMASSFDHGTMLREVRDEIAANRRVDRAKLHKTGSVPLTLGQVIAQLVVAFAIAPAAVGAVIAVQWGGSDWMPLWPFLFGVAAVPVLFITVPVFAAIVAKDRQNLVLWAYFNLVALAAVGGFAAVLVSLLLSVKEWTSLQLLVSGIGVTALAVAYWAFTAYALTHRIPRTRWRGAAFQIAISALDRLIERKQDEKDQHPTRLNLFSWAIIVPPIGIARAVRIHHKYSTEFSGVERANVFVKRSTQAICVGVVAATIICVSAGILWFWNPALPWAT